MDQDLGTFQRPIQTIRDNPVSHNIGIRGTYFGELTPNKIILGLIVEFFLFSYVFTTAALGKRAAS